MQVQTRTNIAIREASSMVGRPQNCLRESSPTGNGTSDLAVVVTVIVAVAAVAPPTGTITGETLHAIAGAPLQLSTTFPLNPPAAPNESICAAGWPAVTVAVAVDAGAREKSGGGGGAAVTVSVLSVVWVRVVDVPTILTK
jgi:hypothetical protein